MGLDSVAGHSAGLLRCRNRRESLWFAATRVYAAPRTLPANSYIYDDFLRKYHKYLCHCSAVTTASPMAHVPTGVPSPR